MPYLDDGTGHRLTDTSERAAHETAPLKLRLRDRVVSALEAAPEGLTCDQVAEAVNASAFSVRPRLTELRRDGRVADSGKRAALRSGKRGIVWTLVVEPPEEQRTLFG